ncbi:hypothetical protein BDP27DRAFT_1403421 [Rhodocollybia butyracea]|uniref:DUF7689 domain-containing protein n=1 Tax=Rhodocollybia butyracea TaxID=206335 RepID=A0A9P5PRP7_9AGAR|nr:hypothetical protein BDP27DRAFT_1403421 [Rhodocollybia butyracea]
MAAPLRPMTDAEWEDIAPLPTTFPMLNRDSPDVMVTGEEDFAYNCFAWSLNREDRWIVPGPTLQDIETYYVKHANFQQTKNPGEADINVYVAIRKDDKVPYVAHFSRKYGDQGLWESKMGKGVRITHPRDALSGGDYGEIAAYYRITGDPPANLFRSPSPNSQLTALVQDLRNLFPNLAAAFDDAYNTWRGEWHRIFPNADDLPTHFMQKGFAPLQNLGARILPFAVGKMQDPQERLVLLLYEFLMGIGSRYRVTKEDPVDFYDWMNRMTISLSLYLQFSQSFHQAVVDWREDDRPDDLYKRIETSVGKGQFNESSIALVMYEYSTNQSEPWDAILQRILGLSAASRSIDQVSAIAGWLGLIIQRQQMTRCRGFSALAFRWDAYGTP